MSRIPKNELERLKEEVSVQRLVEGAGQARGQGLAGALRAYLAARGLDRCHKSGG